MSRLDDIERRLVALEAGGDVATRLAAVEEVLGLPPGTGLTVFPPGALGTDMRECGRCGQTQNVNNLTCHQDKCPLK